MESKLEKMNKRRVQMEDGRRHIFFYTFDDNESEESNRQPRDTGAQREQEKSKEK
ncbi:MAG TPA: hypothetical protein VGB02_15925 [Pyrinomonadaceae bacterium]